MWHGAKRFCSARKFIFLCSQSHSAVQNPGLSVALRDHFPISRYRGIRLMVLGAIRILVQWHNWTCHTQNKSYLQRSWLIPHSSFKWSLVNDVFNQQSVASRFLTKTSYLPASSNACGCWKAWTKPHPAPVLQQQRSCQNDLANVASIPRLGEPWNYMSQIGLPKSSI